MIKGMYRSAAGMMPRVVKQEAIANNLANASTTGFKRDVAFSKELTKAEARRRPENPNWQQALDSRVRVDHAMGVFDKTNNPLDLAIDGDGFFQLEAQDGSTLLTRSGSFIVDSEGFMAFPGGLRLIGDGGPIQVGNGKLVIGDAGEVRVDGAEVGRVVARTVDDVTRLERQGGAMFAVPPGEELVAPLQASIRQGYIESSNVDVVAEMVDMIVAYRDYEANAKALQNQDGTLEHLFHRVASGG
ncbi:flagellar hook-basal body complex protein [candidate division GN15 bacterium]|nr:flagellar hook-basal body complex protein [candidate division GN15 bacterium]